MTCTRTFAASRMTERSSWALAFTPSSLLRRSKRFAASFGEYREPLPERELSKARRYITGRVQLRMEDTGAVASWLGRQELLRGSVFTVDDVVEIIDGITAEDLEASGPASLRT